MRIICIQIRMSYIETCTYRYNIIIKSRLETNELEYLHMFESHPHFFNNIQIISPKRTVYGCFLIENGCVAPVLRLKCFDELHKKNRVRRRWMSVSYYIILYYI